MTNELEHKYQRLKEIVGGYTSAVVAFSGGIDSSLVAYVAGHVLGERALAVEELQHRGAEARQPHQGH